MAQLNVLFNFTKSATPLKAILWSGLVAGILDSLAGVIVYYIYFGMNPFQVLQFIATGVHGPSAMEGGVRMILEGLLYHFIIAYVVAIIYFVAYPKLKVLQKFTLSSGLIYGLGIWLVMNLLILPYTNVIKSPFDLSLAIVGIVWHMILVGVPIAIITDLFYKNLWKD
ncbi:DUF1440 domain-containing protein [Leptobacterium flavescens]|uniref:DUF1440 domain-containing protein n=1 Tax=Leptobacterium flavescens TaxID=472055 RepID=A0A6P0UNA5_9FLAO|nr:DUF1440 domain-containing protein [Leptobacterium flavescens]NER14861.1 DUF1440 domain-containing protein [Leptobacterium flavescens]